MKNIFMTLLVTGTIAAATNAAEEAKPNAAAPAPKRPELTAEQQAQYARLTRTESELNAQLKLLSELIEQHLKRAEDASKSGMAEKNQWEVQLIQELRARNSAVLAQVNDITKRRLVLDVAQAQAPAAEDGKALNANELAYLTRLDERLLLVRQELASIDEAAKGLYSELQTNATTEAVSRISIQLDENTFRGRIWEREQSELELKKLEFRALRK